MLLLCEDSHHDERVQVNPFTEHPEVVATQHVHMEEVQDLTADLKENCKWLLHIYYNIILAKRNQDKECVFAHADSILLAFVHLLICPLWR